MLNLQLSTTISLNAALLEKVHSMQTGNELLLDNMKQFREMFHVAIGNMNKGLESSNMDLITVSVNELKNIEADMHSMNSEQVHITSELETSRDRKMSSKDFETTEKWQCHTQKQVAISNELQKLTDLLTQKECLMELIKNNCLSRELDIEELNNKITTLQFERDELLKRLEQNDENAQKVENLQIREKQIKQLNRKVCSLEVKLTYGTLMNQNTPC